MLGKNVIWPRYFSLTNKKLNI